jgi:predicted dehydrogenase
MTSRPTVSRRRFLRLSTTLAAGIYAAPAIVRAQAQQGKLRLAVIGSQGKGQENINQLTRVGFEVVALCDVDSKKLDAAKAQVEKITGGTYSGKTYSDYRKLYDDTSAFDAVVVSTPDHHHFPATIRALKAKKHVYCEKPLVHTIGEARKIYAAAKEAGVATQMGNQGNASEDLRLTTEWIKGGAIGKVTEAHSWSNRPIWPQGVTWPTQADPIPDGLNWDLWLGPAAERPFYKGCHPFNWRGFWDFGTGAFGDMGCHILNWPFTALDLGSPVSAECVSQEGATKDSPPKKSVIRLDFAAKGDRQALSLFWHDGGNLPSAQQFAGQIPQVAAGKDKEGKEQTKNTENGSLFIGDKGTLYDDYDKGGPTLLPKEKMADFKAPDKTLPRSPGHYEEFLKACNGGPKAGSDFVNKSCALTEMVLIGHLAAHVGPGKKIEWDVANAKVKNIPEANEYVNKKYRPGWVD